MAHASSETTYGIGTSLTYGHTKLSDNYIISSGAASSGIGASSKAVNDAFNYLSLAIKDIYERNTMSVMEETSYVVTSGNITPTSFFDAIGGYMYIVSVTVIFPANVSGKRKIAIGNNDLTQAWGSVVVPVNSASVTSELSLCYIVNPNSNGKIYVWVEQNTGASLACKVGGYAVRIK